MKTSTSLSKKEVAKLKQDRRLAKRQINRMTKALPQPLADKEERIPETLKHAESAPLEKLRHLYALFDELSEHTSRFTACGSGCGDCCRKPVSLSELEIAYIEAETGVTRSTTLIVREGVGDCPFLKDQRCTIYHARPFVCRRHATYSSDNYWCHPDRCNEVEIGLVKFSGMETAMRNLRTIAGAARIFDIRDVFEPVE
ncbi:YkgJ family cysteine cluster protein [Pseudohalioglobus lutimaris]|jgi:Fe-S-cluster containining protein|uniref:YkgJ family cysteine cluster protein n=1 Tax=Pseudohalioglobus lutimaris TaxID=1737061 RepID=A0A2N5WZY0_9GAMM|nr:YkgJ family cysteine cluster protein [Pseudohalioglobus lutimaris]PLW67803.1 hypothetical protein C0039_15405 [Pseudohalioglobus lutimaris]